MIKSILHKFPRLELSVLPTPIHKLEKISEFLSTNIYCLRDDLTGFALGGNKTRKLDFLIADAVNKKADTLIAVGANQSNFCRITAAYGKVNNLEVHLVLAGEKPQNTTGNLLLDHLFGATIHHIDTSETEIIEAAAKKLEIELIKKGKKVYYLPMGGSIPIGTLGYMQAFDEILSFLEEEYFFFFDTVHASGSGGTQAGLVLGKAVSSWNGKVVGMSVGADSKKLFDIVNDLCLETIKKFNWNFSNFDIVTEDAYTGEHYGARTEEAAEAIKLFANLEGIILDEVYTGKAAAGLIDYARSKRFNEKENILFIHTGGFVQLFE